MNSENCLQAMKKTGCFKHAISLKLPIMMRLGLNNIWQNGQLSAYNLYSTTENYIQVYVNIELTVLCYGNKARAMFIFTYKGKK